MGSELVRFVCFFFTRHRSFGDSRPRPGRRIPPALAETAPARPHPQRRRGARRRLLGQRHVLVKRRIPNNGSSPNLFRMRRRIRRQPSAFQWTFSSSPIDRSKEHTIHRSFCSKKKKGHGMNGTRLKGRPDYPCEIVATTIRQILVPSTCKSPSTSTTNSCLPRKSLPLLCSDRFRLATGSQYTEWHWRSSFLILVTSCKQNKPKWCAWQPSVLNAAKKKDK